jgi:integrase
MGKLSALRIKSLVRPGRYGDGDGLWLQVRDAERRAWLFRYRWHGRARAMGLGPLADVALADAREAARECRALLRKGLDPIEHRRAQRAAEQLAASPPFKTVFELYLAAHEAGWRNDKHKAQWRSTLESYALPKLGTRPVSEVATGDVTAVLQPIWTKLPETANRLRGRLEAVLDFAKARGWRSGDNPARWRGHLNNLLPSRAKLAKVKHHAALPYADVAGFVTALRKQPGIAAKALEFAILTAARTGEVIGARWSEIDQARALWTVPAERMKSGREHRLPLSDRAREILEEMNELGGEYVFPGGKPDAPLSNMAMTAVLRRMKRTDITVHGFRSTFRDWAAETTGYAREVAEAALAHTLKDRVEAAYKRGDLLEKRRRLMADWSTYCADSRPRRGVVALKRR